MNSFAKYEKKETSSITKPDQHVFVYDTNCLVALQQSWHIHNGPTRADEARRRHAGHLEMLALPCLTELYSITSRTHPPLTPSPAATATAVSDLASTRSVVALDAAETIAELARIGALGIRGAQVYDGLIAACARKAGAHELVTWNLRHFTPFASPDLAIVNPLGESA